MLIINTSSCDKSSIFVLDGLILLLDFLYGILGASFDIIKFLRWFLSVLYLYIVGNPRLYLPILSLLKYLGQMVLTIGHDLHGWIGRFVILVRL